jgi:hypothetical protein
MKQGAAAGDEPEDHDPARAAEDSTSDPDTPTAQPAHRVRLPRFFVTEPVGLGDVVKRLTSAAGVPPCGGCQERAAQLNRWVRIDPRR